MLLRVVQREVPDANLLCRTHVSASITSRSHAVLFIIIFLQLSGAPAKQLRSFQSAAHNEMRTLCLGSLVLRGGGSSRHIADRRAGLVCGPFSLTRDESVNGTASEGSQALAEVNLLAKERERIEEAISDTKQGLARMGAPDHTPGHFSEQYVPLLDAEGYPRNDIPVLEILVRQPNLEMGSEPKPTQKRALTLTIAFPSARKAAKRSLHCASSGTRLVPRPS